MRTLSLSWGRQSFALAAMSARGVLPSLDAAIFADTSHERAETYEFAARWTPWLEERGVRVVTVRAQAKTISIIDGQTPPLFTLETATGKRGMLNRTCGDRWKIREIKRWVRAQIEKGEVVETWIGYTWDEAHRMKTSGASYQRLVYPLIEAFDRPMTCADVTCWLHDNGLEVPVKSACVFCPFHSRALWREIQLSGNGDWEKALAVDYAIRDRRLDAGYKCYLTAERKPLNECDFRSEEECGQMRLWGKQDDLATE